MSEFEQLELYAMHMAAVRKCMETNHTTGIIENLRRASVTLYEIALETLEKNRKLKFFHMGERLYALFTLYENAVSVDNHEHEQQAESSERQDLMPKSATQAQDFFDTSSVPSITFDDVAGLEDVKEIISDRVLKPVKSPEMYDGYDLKSGGGVFLYGPPGTGKTMIAAAIANEIDAPFITVRGSDLYNKWQGETENRIKKLFAQARNHKRCVIFFDEMEALTPRETTSSGTVQARAELLAQLQGIEEYFQNDGTVNEMLLVIGATNKPWDVDGAFLRQGRFGDYRIFVDLPDAVARKQMIRNRLKYIDINKVTVEDTLDIDKIGEEITFGFNGADVTSLFDRAQIIAIKRYKETGMKTFTTDDFIMARKDITPSVDEKDMSKYREWKNKFN